MKTPKGGGIHKKVQGGVVRPPTDMTGLMQHKLVVATFFLACKLPDLALECCLEVQEHLKETPHTRLSALCAFHLGQALYFLGRPAEARRHLVEAAVLGRMLARAASDQADRRACWQLVGQTALFLAKVHQEGGANPRFARRLLNVAETLFCRAECMVGVALVRHARAELHTPTLPPCLMVC